MLDDPAAMEAVCELLGGLYGRKFTADDYLAMGKRILAWERRFNSAAGFGPADDRLPDFFKTEKLAPHGAMFSVPDEELDQLFSFVE